MLPVYLLWFLTGGTLIFSFELYSPDKLALYTFFTFSFLISLVFVIKIYGQCMSHPKILCAISIFQVIGSYFLKKFHVALNSMRDMRISWCHYY